MDDQMKDANNYIYRYSWFHLARPLTLSGTISPVLVGTAFAANKAPIDVTIFIVFFIATLFIQIATNIFNDYFDFKHGQDQQKWLKNAPRKHPKFRELPFVACTFLLVAAILGIWLTVQSGFWLAFVGILGIVFGFCYSAGKYSLASLGLGEIVAATFLGFATTMLPYVIQGNQIDVEIFLIAFPFALMIATMILTNNVRDIDKDKGFRRTVPIIIGRTKAIQLLTFMFIVIYTSVIAFMMLDILPKLTVIVFLASPIAIRLCLYFKDVRVMKKDIDVMKWAAYHHWTFGLLFASAMWVNLFI